jgi:hypothetical protein
MKDELRSAVAEAMDKSESQAEICRGGKIRKSLFFCPAYLSAILPLGWPAALKPPRPPQPRRRRRGKRGQTVSNRCFWSKCPSNGENLNPGLSQCVAVSRSDKFVKGAGSPQPFSLSTFSWRQQRRRIRVHSRLELPPLVAWSRWVKLGQTDQGFDGVSPCHKSIWKYFKMNSLQNNG